MPVEEKQPACLLEAPLCAAAARPGPGFREFCGAPFWRSTYPFFLKALFYFLVLFVWLVK